MPIGLILAPLGEPLAILAFGERWALAGQVTAAICLFIPAQTIASVIGEGFKGTGIPAKRTRVNAIAVAAGAVAMLALAPPLGLFGVGIGISVDAIAGAAVAIALASRTMEIPVRSFLVAIAPAAGAALLMIAVLYPLENLLVDAADHGVLLGLPLLTAEVLVGVAIYLLALRFLAPGLGHELLGLLRTARRRPAPGGRGRRRAARGRGKADASGMKPTARMADDGVIDRGEASEMPRDPTSSSSARRSAVRARLRTYLGEHPEIGMCPRKESHFFADDEVFARLQMHPDRRRKELDEYLSWFGPLQGRRRLGEASVWYLYSAGSGARIRDFRPDAQIIAMIRNPLTAVPALHSEFVHMGIEPERDLERAFALDHERERRGTPTGFPPRSYRAAFRFAEQIAAYHRLFGRRNVDVVVFDDFVADTARHSRASAPFSRRPGSSPRPGSRNANKEARSRRFQGLVKRPPEPLRRGMHLVTTESTRELLASRLSPAEHQIAPARAHSGCRRRRPVTRDRAAGSRTRRAARTRSRKLGRGR